MIDLKNIKKVLTFFAHPDDETLAAGATIGVWTGVIGAAGLDHSDLHTIVLSFLSVEEDYF